MVTTIDYDLMVRRAVAALLLIWIALQGLCAPAVEFGDSREYILQTQAIVFDRSIAIDPQLRGEYWNATNPFGAQLSFDRAPQSSRAFALEERRQYGGGFGSLYPARSGEYYFAHPAVYSMAVAPIYAVLHMLVPGSGEYAAFRIANILFLGLPLVLMLRASLDWRSIAYVAVLCASPLSPHVQFAHGELFCFCCVTLSFLGLRCKRLRGWSPILLGLGASQNIPILLFFPFHCLLSFCCQQRNAVGLQRGLRLFIPYVFAACFPLAVGVFSYAHFGAWNLIAGLGQANVANLFLTRLVSVIASPMIGVVWYLPAAWIGAALALVSGRVRDLLIFGAACACVGALSCTTANINSAQLAAPRYAVWFLAPLYVLPYYCHLFEGRWSGVVKSTSIGCAVSVALMWWWLSTFKFLAGEWMLFSSLNRASPEVAAIYRRSKFHDDIEPLVENIRGRELQAAHEFNGIYVWNLGRGRSLWVVSKRALNRIGSVGLKLKSDREINRSALSEVFRTEDHQGGRILLFPRKDTLCKRHPVWGGYRFIWLAAEVESLEGSGGHLIVR